MKDLIEKIEALKIDIDEFRKMNPSQDNLIVAIHKNETIDCVLEILQSLPSPIQAKALRKMGTDKWYITSDADYEVWDYPDIWSKNILLKPSDAPLDAELIDIEIYVKPKEK